MNNVSQSSTCNSESSQVLETLSDLKDFYDCPSCSHHHDDPLHEIHILQNASQMLYSKLNSAMNLSWARIKSLQTDNENTLLFQGEGLSNPLVNHLLKPATHRFICMIDTITSSIDEAALKSLSSSLIRNTNETKILCQVLQLFTRLTQLDITLTEEMAKCGSHFYLSKIIHLDSSSIVQSIYGSKESFVGNEANGELKSEGLLSRQFIFEQDEDVLTEIQDEACEIVYDSRLPNLTFPVKISPFTTDELIHRLPLEFQVQSPYYVQDDSHDHDVFASKMSFLIQQVTDRQSAQEDVGFGKFFKFQLGFVF